MTQSAIIVHESFERSWSWVADHWHKRWQEQEEDVFFKRIDFESEVLSSLVDNAESIKRLVVLGHGLTAVDLKEFTSLKELVYQPRGWRDDQEEVDTYCEEHGVHRIKQKSEGFWGQSVAEFGFALTLCGLRRIPQTHHNIIASLDDWNYGTEKGAPSARCGQFGDDANFTCGTLAGKRVRIVGAGNIASRYADWCSMMGADVAMWDPFASEPCFHRAGARRVHHLAELMKDAEIFAPMLPLMEATRGIVTADMIKSLPKGCLVVQVTRAAICDTEELYKRVLNDELALAADVFDAEPVPLESPLLGRHNVVHTPHNAGRTKESNWSWADALIDQFAPS